MPSVVRMYGSQLKASIAMIRLKLYDVLSLLPPESFDSRLLANVCAVLFLPCIIANRPVFFMLAVFCVVNYIFHHRFLCWCALLLHYVCEDLLLLFVARLSWVTIMTGIYMPLCGGSGTQFVAAWHVLCGGSGALCFSRQHCVMWWE